MRYFSKNIKIYTIRENKSVFNCDLFAFLYFNTYQTINFQINFVLFAFNFRSEF